MVMGSTSLWADPSDNVTADQPLYQRVKKLENYGLLDLRDQAVLDQGLPVTRLELAFYTEKAKVRFEAPTLASPFPTPTMTAAPTSTPGIQVPPSAAGIEIPPSAPGAPASPLGIPGIPGMQAPASAPGVQAPASPAGVQAPVSASGIQAPASPAGIQAPPSPATNGAPLLAPAPSGPGMPLPAGISPLSPESVPTFTLPTAPASSALPGSLTAPEKSAIRTEIDELLKELHQESEMLRNRVGLDDYRIQQQQTELDKLKSVQDEIDAIFNKANKTVGNPPKFSTVSDMRVENMNVSGITQISASSFKSEVNLGVWSDLGGKGSISVGLGTYIYSSISDPSSAPASIYLFAPKITFSMDGMLGHWDNTFAVEDYTADVYLGDFSRGLPLSNLAYEHPFDIKIYSTDQNMKNWDDYMNNLGYVPSFSSFSSQSNSGVVFDGIYMLGSNLPLVSKEAKAVILFGRMGTVNTSENDEHRLEEGLKYSQPWLGGFLQTTLSAEFVNENFGITPPNTPAMDQRNYDLDMVFNLNPFSLTLKGGFSQLETGMYTPLNQGVTIYSPSPLEAPAGQASLSYYPFTVYYTAISDTFSDLQGTAYTAGFNLNNYGYSYADSASNPHECYYGFVGMVDDMISDRYGWRANIGWQGRQQPWMKSWPSILDDILINLDVAKKTEYSVIDDETGRNVIETYKLVNVFYPDDLGLWGNSIWGGYSGPLTVGQAYMNNISGIRNDATTEAIIDGLGVGYMERIPFILPVNNEPVQDINGKPVTFSNGTNTYLNLDNLKTFNYVALKVKLQFNKMMGLAQPFYGSIYFNDNQISGTTTTPSLMNIPDPNRPGQTLANIPDMFSQTVWDWAVLYQLAKHLNLLGDYGLELWNSDYTYPIVNSRTDCLGAGIAYDLPWGTGKLELRYKHLNYQDFTVTANSYQANQIYSYFLFQF